MQNLKVTLVQAEMAWEDKTANYTLYHQLLTGLKGKTDLVILPEMYNTGFSMNPQEFAEDMNGEGVAFLRKLSGDLNAVVTASLIIHEDGKFFNRLIWAVPGGELLHYDKKHLFTMAGEHEYYSPGNKKLVVELKGWKICPLVCYDLRFPVWVRNTENYDLLTFNANWPEKRSSHWKKLLPARAIENQCFVVGVNRVGNDGNKIYHSGDSMVCDPMGETLALIAHEEQVYTVELNYDRIKKTRRHMPFLRDADKFRII